VAVNILTFQSAPIRQTVSAKRTNIKELIVKRQRYGASRWHAHTNISGNVRQIVRNATTCAYTTAWKADAAANADTGKCCSGGRWYGGRRKAIELIATLTSLRQFTLIPYVAAGLDRLLLLLLLLYSSLWWL
jgi:hypothetical protein